MELVKKTEQEIEKCRQAQKDFCKYTNAPLFAPHSGTCYRCGKNIYQNYERIAWNYSTGETESVITGISFQQASNELITGCPHCNYSFCE